MKNLIASKDNRIEPKGAIGVQKCGIIFWQKTGFLKHCNMLKFQAAISLISQKFVPTNIQNRGTSCFIQFDHNDEKMIYISLKKEPDSKHFFIYGESHTVYADADFHIFALNLVNYIAKEFICKFFVDDATNYLEHRSVEKLKAYIENFKSIELSK